MGETMTATTWNLSWAGATDKGKVRNQNQDNFYTDPAGRFLILADGMGGHSGGEIASERTVEAVKAYLESMNWDSPPPPQSIDQTCINKAAESLTEWVQHNIEHQDLGTTLVVWVRTKDKIVLFSLGDSRVYLFREEALFQLTFDQTIETELRRRGASRNQAARSPGSGYLSRCVLAHRICEPDVFEVEIRQGDTWLLCSDGLTREVENEEITNVLSEIKKNGPQSCVQDLISMALANGGRDNVTVVIASII
jgi:protein phosphatase